MKILRYIFCAASALFFVAAFCACEKDGAVLGGESVDYGTLEVADVYLYNNYPEAEILFEFSDPQYAEKPVFTFDSNLFVIEGSRVILRNAPAWDKRVTVFAETSYHFAEFEVVCAKNEFMPGFETEVEHCAQSLKDYADGEVVFAGDSFFSKSYWQGFDECFGDMGAYAVGIGSSTAFQWEIFARKILYPVCPTVLALHIGTNALGGGSVPEKTAEALILLFRNLLLNMPETEIYWFTVEPRDGVETAKIRELNRIICDYAENTPRLFVLDSFSRFAPDGAADEIMYTDGVHPSETGYEVFPSLLEEAGVIIPPKA